jgi:hypothetical protein
MDEEDDLSWTFISISLSLCDWEEEIEKEQTKKYKVA